MRDLLSFSQVLRVCGASASRLPYVLFSCAQLFSFILYEARTIFVPEPDLREVSHPDKVFFFDNTSTAVGVGHHC